LTSSQEGAGTCTSRIQVRLPRGGWTRGIAGAFWPGRSASSGGTAQGRSAGFTSTRGALAAGRITRGVSTLRFSGRSGNRDGGLEGVAAPGVDVGHDGNAHGARAVTGDGKDVAPVDEAGKLPPRPDPLTWTAAKPALSTILALSAS